jgi:hypothetical protein
MTRLFSITLGLLLLSGPLEAKKPKAAPLDPQDTIEVVGHVALSGGAVTRFLVTRHYSSSYLYAEVETGKTVVLLDVSKPARPAILGNVAASAGLLSVTGTAALVSDSPTAATAQLKPQSIRIMDFSDPQHPKVAREFNGVTAIGRDDSRNLIFLANPEGVWILHQTLADDPEVEKEYAHHVLYDH